MQKKLDNLFHEMRLIDMDNIWAVSLFAMNFEKWVKWNKGEVDIEIIELKKFNTIVVVHDIFDHIDIGDAWEFQKSAINCLKEYIKEEDEELRKIYECDVYGFWHNKLNGKM